MSAAAVTQPNAITYDGKSYLRVRVLPSVNDQTLCMAFNACLTLLFQEIPRQLVYDTKNGFNRKVVAETPLLTKVLNELEEQLEKQHIQETIEEIWVGTIGIYIQFIHSDDSITVISDIVQAIKEETYRFGDGAQVERIRISDQ